MLSLNPETLWFKDEGETDEGEHIMAAEPTAEEAIDWTGIFNDGRPLSRKEIIERCNPLGYDDRTIDRLLKKAKDRGVLKCPKFGFYQL